MSSSIMQKEAFTVSKGKKNEKKKPLRKEGRRDFGPCDQRKRGFYLPTKKDAYRQQTIPKKRKGGN